jgi:DNA-binding MarR family transcriptional regulator
MQHHLPNRVSTTDQHANFLNERITSVSRFHRLLAKVHPDAIEQLDYRRERQVYLLTNGQRTIGQIASLLDIHPINVAHMMKQLLEKGYVELL